jgi:hypothetical protein
MTSLGKFSWFLGLVSLIGCPHLGLASGCDSYPYTIGMNIEDVAGGTKIIATESVGVSFDDVDAINDARDEATIKAKTLIAKFFQEIPSSDEAISRAVTETKSMQGESKAQSRSETITRVKQLRNQSAAMLRGVVMLGDCYTAGKEMRVSVGLKPETIASAGRASQAIGQSMVGQTPVTPSSPGGANPGATQAPSQPLNRVPSFNNSERLKTF